MWGYYYFPFSFLSEPTRRAEPQQRSFSLRSTSSRSLLLVVGVEVQTAQEEAKVIRVPFGLVLTQHRITIHLRNESKSQEHRFVHDGNRDDLFLVELKWKLGRQ